MDRVILFLGGTFDDGACRAFDLLSRLGMEVPKMAAPKFAVEMLDGLLRLRDGICECDDMRKGVVIFDGKYSREEYWGRPRYDDEDPAPCGGYYQ